MRFKTIFIIIIFSLFVSVSSFSQMVSFGPMGTYNPVNPSFWSAGIMLSVTGDYSKENAHFFRMGMTFGKATVTYEKENPFTSKHEMTEYWQKSNYIDWIFGYVYQKGLGDIFALRLGGDFYFSYAAAYMDPDSYDPLAWNFGLTGIAGVALFPKGKYFVHLDACPGFTLNYIGTDIMAYILPIRISVGTNW